MNLAALADCIHTQLRTVDFVPNVELGDFCAATPKSEYYSESVSISERRVNFR